jgi:hypothetical protein
MREDQSIVIACLLWRWWTRRNEINAKERTGDPAEILSQVHFWAGEANIYCSKTVSEKPSTEKCSWQKPRGDTLKINIDRSFFAEKRLGGWGFAVRDQFGQIWGAGAGQLTYAASAAQTEVRACEEAVRAAANRVMSG